jgi:hypothetical protein
MGLLRDMIEGAFSVDWEAASTLSRRLGVGLSLSVVAQVVALKRLTGA